MTLSRVMALVLMVAAAAAPTAAQDPPRPAFSLSSRQIFTTKASPALDLVFQELTHLDFRVYRVKDPRAFFAGLVDPHQLGSPEPVVPQEQTWLERIAGWKASRRTEIKRLLRAQVSTRYRTERRARANQAEIQQRQTLGYQSFAQVPLLNAVAARRVLARGAPPHA